MNQQRSFFDEQDRLDKLNALIDWDIFRPQLKRCFKKEPKGPGGRPPFDYVLMFKILILQRLYNLSDALMQHQILDRLSFQRFLGQGLYASVPDEKTIWLFREVSSKQEIIEKLFDRYTAHLEKQGLITNKGSIIDASLVEVPRQRNSREENAKIRGGTIPEGWDEDPCTLRQKDTDARWTKKNEKTLEKRGVRSKIHEKANRNQPLTKAQMRSNRVKSRIRARVEHVFAQITNSMKGFRIRSIGIRRAGGIIGLINLAYNIVRSVHLQGA